ncbi:hypothetical protein D3C83_296830 [compost metagenome]
MVVSIGSLDEPVKMKPVVQYGLEGRMPWLVEIFATPGTTTGAAVANGTTASALG